MWSALRWRRERGDERRNFYRGSRIGDRPTGDYRTLVETDRDTSDLIRMEVLLRGYFIAAGLGLCLSVPMEIEHIDGLVGAIGESLASE